MGLRRIGKTSRVRVVPVQKLRPETFAPFGQADVNPPRGAARAEIPSKVIRFYPDHINFGLERPTRSPLFVRDRCGEDAVTTTVERHRRPECFSNLTSPLVVLVAAPGDSPELKGFKAFKVEVGESFVLGTGVWHATPYPDGGVNMWVRVETKPGIMGDCETFDFPKGEGLLPEGFV